MPPQSINAKDAANAPPAAHRVGAPTWHEDGTSSICAGKADQPRCGAKGRVQATSFADMLDSIAGISLTAFGALKW
jgi:hypothetical protein